MMFQIRAIEALLGGDDRMHVPRAIEPRWIAHTNSNPAWIPCLLAVLRHPICRKIQSDSLRLTAELQVTVGCP